VEVVVGVHHQQRLACQLRCDRADVADAEARVQEDRGPSTLDQERVDVPRLAHEVHAGLELPDVEPGPSRKLALPRGLPLPADHPHVSCGGQGTPRPYEPPATAGTMAISSDSVTWESRPSASPPPPSFS